MNTAALRLTQRLRLVDGRMSDSDDAGKINSRELCCLVAQIIAANGPLRRRGEKLAEKLHISRVVRFRIDSSRCACV